MTDYQAIRFDVAPSGVATLTLHRPEQKNGLNWQMAEETRDVLLGPARDHRVKVLVLTGVGRLFSPGASAAEPRVSPKHDEEPGARSSAPLSSPSASAVTSACPGP